MPSPQPAASMHSNTARSVSIIFFQCLQKGFVTCAGGFYGHNIQESGEQVNLETRDWAAFICKNPPSWILTKFVMVENIEEDKDWTDKDATIKKKKKKKKHFKANY